MGSHGRLCPGQSVCALQRLREGLVQSQGKEEYAEVWLLHCFRNPVVGLVGLRLVFSEYQRPSYLRY